MEFNPDLHPLFSDALNLTVLPVNAPVPVINGQRLRYGVPQVFASSAEIVVIEAARPETNKADNQAARASRLWRILWRSVEPSVSLRDGGR